MDQEEKQNELPKLSMITYEMEMRAEERTVQYLERRAKEHKERVDMEGEEKIVFIDTDTISAEELELGDQYEKQNERPKLSMITYEMEMRAEERSVNYLEKMAIQNGWIDTDKQTQSNNYPNLSIITEEMEIESEEMVDRMITDFSEKQGWKI